MGGSLLRGGAPFVWREVEELQGDDSNDVLVLPLLPLRGVSVFPSTVVPLQVGRDKSLRALEEAIEGGRQIFLATQRELNVDDPTAEDLFEIGTFALVNHFEREVGGMVKLVVEGVCRARILDYVQEEPYFRVCVELFAEDQSKTQEIETLTRSVAERYEEYIKINKKMTKESLAAVANIKEPGRFADIIAANLILKPEDKQRVLEAVKVRDRLKQLYVILNREIEVLELERRINLRVRKQMERSHREYYLREQIKAIQRELGERDDRGTEAEEFREKLGQKNLPSQVEEKVLREIERLEKMPPMVAESVVVRNYLEWILSLPWSEETQDELDLERAEKILDEDHYGLEEIKERILEFLAIRHLTEEMKGPILCLVGPPGVGKTSLARSVARAIGRKFVRVSLGGVRDEAEIRGHRRTYVGAMPGRIIQGMKQAGSCNPVFLLDEIDKMSSDFRGDPSAALMEVLDPEQNTNFSDHYIEVPYDLSRVMFIATANNRYSIPRPLLDRMEIIEIPGYTEEEKLRIAQGFLIPKQIKANGLKEDQLTLSENALRKIIREYTREAGVRNLERQIASLCRKTAKQVVRGKTSGVRLTTQSIEKLLGHSRYRYGMIEKEDQVGVATGLGWTDMGGNTMPIEVSVLDGKGNFVLTGSLGDIMKESARAAQSYIRSRAADLGLDRDFADNKDIHIHIPEGAIPKDGPSAGISIATALVSALTSIPVRKEVAMTGEITLRGRILPVGGLKEKILAAHRAGLETVILPADNEKDLKDVPANVRRRLNFVLVDHMDQVLEAALTHLPEREDGDETASLAAHNRKMDGGLFPGREQPGDNAPPPA